MKTSNKILLIAGVIPVIFSILLPAALKYLWIERDTMASSAGSSAMIARTLPLKGFNEITIEGVWEINLVQGDSFLVNVSGPESLMRGIKIEESGNKLVINGGTKFKTLRDVKLMKADITLPEIAGINTEGFVSLGLSDMNIDSLAINSQGAILISGDEAVIKDIRFTGQGLTFLDLKTVPIVNADIGCEGVYVIELLMNGGRLSGTTNGLGHFIYQGDVSVNELLVNGSKDMVVHING